MSKKTSKSDTNKPLSNTMSTAFFIQYVREAIDFFELRFMTPESTCEECDELHPREEDPDMFMPHAITDWEKYMAYDLPPVEDMRKILKSQLHEKLDALVESSVQEIEDYFHFTQEDYPTFKQERAEREAAKTKLKETMTKEQWEALQTAFPIMESILEHDKELTGSIDTTNTTVTSTTTHYDVN